MNKISLLPSSSENKKEIEWKSGKLVFDKSTGKVYVGCEVNNMPYWVGLNGVIWSSKLSPLDKEFRELTSGEKVVIEVG